MKLLRVLQEQEFEPLGGGKTVRVNVRVIAATNRDLSAMVRDGKFRSDPLLPPQRSAGNDAAPPRACGRHFTALHFLSPKVCEEAWTSDQTRSPRKRCGFSRAYSWPGNIRELQNVIERAVVLTTGTVLRVDESLLPQASNNAPAYQHGVKAAGTKPIEPSPSPIGDGAALEDVERQHIIAVLKKADWRIEGKGGAANTLNLNPSTLRSRMRKLGITRHSV